MGFCMQHAEMVRKQGMPIGVSDFIRACGIDPETYTKNSAEYVSDILQALAEDVEEEIVNTRKNIQTTPWINQLLNTNASW